MTTQTLIEYAVKKEEDTWQNTHSPNSTATQWSLIHTIYTETHGHSFSKLTHKIEAIVHFKCSLVLPSALLKKIHTDFICWVTWLTAHRSPGTLIQPSTSLNHHEGTLFSHPTNMITHSARTTNQSPKGYTQSNQPQADTTVHSPSPRHIFLSSCGCSTYADLGS